MIGIYRIRSKIKPDRLYIGSAFNIQRRWYMHRRDFKLNKHHSIKFQRHYNKYSLDDLEFTVLLECNKDKLIEIEQFFIDAYTPYFNVRLIADNNKGIKMSEETKRKIADKQRGHIMPLENKLKLMNKNKGNKYSVGRKTSDETKLKMSIARKGKSATWNLGKKASDATRELLSKQRIGNKNGKYLKGIKRSPETKEKMRQSLIKSWKEGRRCRRSIV